MAEETPDQPEDMTITEDLDEIKGELTAIFHGQGQRITEFRVVVAQGLRKAEEEVEALLKGAQEIVRRNGEILREAAEAQASSDRFEKLQGDIDGQIADLKHVNNDLGDTCERLRNEREELSKARKALTEGNDGIREEIHKLTGEIDRLEIDNEVLGKELATLQRNSDSLQREVDALNEKRQELLSSLAKYKEVKSGLLG